MEMWQIVLISFGVTLAVVLAKYGLDAAGKAIDKKRAQLIADGEKASAWLSILDVIVDAASVAVGAVEQTTVKRYKEAVAAGTKLTPEQQEAAWREAGESMLRQLPQFILDKIIELVGTDKEAQLQYLRTFIENEIDARKNPEPAVPTPIG